MTWLTGLHGFQLLSLLHIGIYGIQTGGWLYGISIKPTVTDTQYKNILWGPPAVTVEASVRTETMKGVR